jgi:hypothetical protein
MAPCSMPLLSMPYPLSWRRWGLAPGGQTPGVDVLVAFVLQPLEAFAVCMDGTAIFLQDAVLRRGGTHDCRAPPQRGRAPMGPAWGTESGSEQKGCAAQRGVCAIAHGVFTGPGASAHRLLFDFGALDCGQIP